MTPAFIMHAGRILPVVALVKQNGIPNACIMIGPKTPLLVPLAIAAPAAAPQRRGIRLVCQDGVRV